MGEAIVGGSHCWFDSFIPLIESFVVFRAVLCQTLSDISRRPTVGINMNGLFLEEPPYRETT